MVQKNGDIYVFLTDEEQEINRAIESQNVDSGEVIAKVSEMIFDGLYDEKKYRYPAFNGRYAFAFNQVVDDKPYKANQNNDITLKILTPNSDERADETTMRILSGQSSCVLVVLPDDRTFLDEIRSALQIEKFIRFDATNAVTQFESIKEAKKVEMRERNGAAKLFLSESLKNAEIYVNGDKIQSGAKEIASKINDALGKLVSTVYHKLSYIDAAMGESDIRTLFKNNGQQLTLAGTNTAKNELALHDVNDYIALNTQRHMKTSMKSILERFLKAPYGFVEADVLLSSEKSPQSMFGGLQSRTGVFVELPQPTEKALPQENSSLKPTAILRNSRGLALEIYNPAVIAAIINTIGFMN